METASRSPGFVLECRSHGECHFIGNTPSPGKRLQFPKGEQGVAQAFANLGGSGQGLFEIRFLLSFLFHGSLAPGQEKST